MHSKILEFFDYIIGLFRKWVGPYIISISLVKHFYLIFVLYILPVIYGKVICYWIGIIQILYLFENISLILWYLIFCQHLPYLNLSISIVVIWFVFKFCSFHINVNMHTICVHWNFKNNWNIQHYITIFIFVNFYLLYLLFDLYFAQQRPKTNA